MSVITGYEVRCFQAIVLHRDFESMRMEDTMHVVVGDSLLHAVLQGAGNRAYIVDQRCL